MIQDISSAQICRAAVPRRIHQGVDRSIQAPAAAKVPESGSHVVIVIVLQEPCPVKKVSSLGGFFGLFLEVVVVRDGNPNAFPLPFS